jgi:HK97 family phage prohead protease
MQLVSLDTFRAEGRRLDPTRTGVLGFRPSKDAGGVFRVSTVEPKAMDAGTRTIRFCFSDGSVDRMGDTIDPNGWRINDFMANPVALWAHDSSAPPIGRASNVLVEDDRLMGDITFADLETYAFADTIYRLLLGKFVNAVSVGFLPVEYKWADDEDGRPWGIDFKVQDLLEISVCPVPANPNALNEARSKGIDTRPLVEWAEKALEGGGKIIIPRGELEALRKAAAEPKRHRHGHAPAPKPFEPGWLKDLAASLKPLLRDGDGLSETDPASGGVLVATCGRTAEEECGLINPQECAVHMAQETEDKRVARLVARGVRAEMKRLGLVRSAAKPRRRDAADGDPDEMKPEHEECIRRALDHLDQADACFKAADEHYDAGDDAHQEALDHHQAAMDELETVRDALGEDPPDDTAAPSDGVGDDGEARRLRRLRRLAAQHAD